MNYSSPWRISGLALVIAGCGLLPGTRSIAADLPEAAPVPADKPMAESWELNIAPYGWAAGINGTVAQFGLAPSDVDADFIDILKNLDMAAMIVAEARRGRFGIFADIIYTDISAGGSGPLGAFSVNLDNQLFAGTALAEYRAVENGRSSLDVMAGARVWSVNTEANITAGVGAGLSFSDSATWVDPMIAVKARLQGSSPWYLTAWGMVGGFGISADIDWDLMGAAGYEFNDRFSVVAGYRAAGVDYQDGPFVFDVILSGPIVGGVIRF